MLIKEIFFVHVPQHQYLMLKQFVNEHPYKEFNNKGIKHEYIITGKGKRTIILLSGALFNPYMWFYIIEKLKKDFCIIAPKFPKIGAGAKESVKYIKNILDNEKVSKSVVVGYSYGGGIAQYFAEVHPEYIDTLVLSHSGILRREDSIKKTEKMISKLRFLPSFSINIIKYLRTKSGKESEWYSFRKALLNLMSESITKIIFIDHFNKNLEFLKEIEYLPVGRVSWKGKTIILATRSDKDTFKYYDELTSIYNVNISHIFNEPGGHHMIFLYPEKYTYILIKLIQQTGST